MRSIDRLPVLSGRQSLVEVHKLSLVGGNRWQTFNLIVLILPLEYVTASYLHYVGTLRIRNVALIYRRN